MKAPFPARDGYSLLELLVGLSLGSIVFAATLAAFLFLQKSYAATEQYAVNLADQTRLLDQLSMDLRRATGATLQTDANGAPSGLTAQLPDYYSADTVPRSPRLNPQATYQPAYQAAYYGDTQASTLQVVYRLRATFQDPRAGSLFNVVTRQEGTGTEAAIAAAADGFPTVTFDTPSGATTTVFQNAIQCRLRVAFQPKFQTLGSSESNRVVLHNLTFLRNNDARFK